MDSAQNSDANHTKICPSWTSRSKAMANRRSAGTRNIDFLQFLCVQLGQLKSDRSDFVTIEFHVCELPKKNVFGIEKCSRSVHV